MWHHQLALKSSWRRRRRSCFEEGTPRRSRGDSQVYNPISRHHSHCWWNPPSPARNTHYKTQTTFFPNSLNLILKFLSRTKRPEQLESARTHTTDSKSLKLEEMANATESKLQYMKELELKGSSSQWNSSQIVQKDWSKLRVNSARNGSKSHLDPAKTRSKSLHVYSFCLWFFLRIHHTYNTCVRTNYREHMGTWLGLGFKVGVGYLRVFPLNFTVSPSWLHMLGRGGIVGNQSDFLFIGIVDTLHFFWGSILAFKKKLSSIKWWYKKLRCIINGLHRLFKIF
jgi:hypothetical protein